jgi:hypothetical protein
MLHIDERQVVMLRTIYWSLTEESISESKVIHDIYKQYNESQISEIIQAGRLRWLECLFWKQKQDLAESLHFLNQRVMDEWTVLSAIAWLESAEDH